MHDLCALAWVSQFPIKRNFCNTTQWGFGLSENKKAARLYGWSLCKELLYNLAKTWCKKNFVCKSKKVTFQESPVSPRSCLASSELPSLLAQQDQPAKLQKKSANVKKMFPTHVSAWLICQVSGDDCGQRQRGSVKQTDAAFQENSVFFLTLTLDYSQRQGMIAKNMRDVTLIIFLCVLISIKGKFF